VTLGPALILSALIGIVCTAIYVLARGHAGGRLPITVVAASLGAWAGDALGERLGIDVLLIGDYHIVSAFVVAWVGIGIVALLAILAPAGRQA
jgi:hypothetical protein